MTGATLTAGLRATWNTNPVNPKRLFARPAGSFLDLSHDVNQPLNQAIETKVRNLFPATPLFVCAAARCPLAYQLATHTAFTRASASSTTSFPRRLPTWQRRMRLMLADLRGWHRRTGGRRGDRAGSRRAARSMRLPPPTGQFQTVFS